MPRKDFYHDCVRQALMRDGWTITDDPLYVDFLDSDLQIDLGAERIEVTKGTVKIAVEVKNFLNVKAPANEYHKALGQMINYRELLSIQSPERDLYLAVSEEAYDAIFSRTPVKSLIARLGLKIVVFSPTSETITKWNP